MRAVLILVTGTIWIASSALARQQLDAPPEVVASREATRQFGATLLDALQQAVRSGGPVNGIAVCRDRAGQVATDLGQRLGMLVGRTSLKVRNPANAPDNWELAVLKQFEARKAVGEPVDQLEFFAVIEDDQGQKTFRYMKAIPTAAPCLNCHGENLSPEVDAKLKELYPNDLARGFKAGDLRGAFTLAKPLP
jgi:hypothetical protein